MIHNDPSRSGEFITKPVQAGRAAREMPLTLNVVLLLIFLATAILQLVSEFYNAQAKDYLDQIRAQELAQLNETLDVNQAQLATYFTAFQDWLYAHPLLATLLLFISTVVFIFTMGIVRSKQVEGFDLIAFFSAMARISLVKNLVNTLLILIVGIGFMLSEPFGANLQIILAIAAVPLIFWSFFLYQGALETKTVWGALGVVVISSLLLSMIALTLAMIISVIRI